MISSNVCASCGTALNAGDKFCQKCGTQAKMEPPASAAFIKSSGSYSGKITKGGTGFFKKLFIGLLVLVAIGSAGLLIWFQMDPDAGKKLQNAGEMAGAGFVILLFLWIYFKGGKKKKRRRGSSSRRSDDAYDNDDDSDDFDDSDDSGGDDD